MTPIKLKHSEMRLIDDIFGMGGGYVLDFSNKTFAEFFDDELGINIDDPKWDAEGTSKAKRLRFFLRNNEPDANGPEASSSAKAVSPMKEFRPSAEDVEWSAWTVWTYMKCWSASSHSQM